jgi:glutamate-1-semialdehyde 2,1-aminomutase
MPLVLFEDDPSYQKGVCWATEAIGNGVYLHPFHNMFLCAAHRPEDLKEALERTDAAFAAVRRKFGAD